MCPQLLVQCALLAAGGKDVPLDPQVALQQEFANGPCTGLAARVLLGCSVGALMGPGATGYFGAFLGVTRLCALGKPLVIHATCDKLVCLLVLCTCTAGCGRGVAPRTKRAYVAAFRLC